MDNLAKYIVFIVIGYLSGSILYARLIPEHLCGIDIRELSEDHNPGTFNAFKYAGKRIGILVIIMELLKGFVPVYMAATFLNRENLWFALVIAAPAAGHAFPFLKPGNGGKAIAVSFGSLLGLLPDLGPVLTLAAFYILFSLFLVIHSHLRRSIITFVCFCMVGVLLFKNRAYILGSILISCIVIVKHLMAKKLQGKDAKWKKQNI